MRTSTFVLIALIIVLITDIILFIISEYKYSKTYESYWSLAEKASSIEKKIEGIDKFVLALSKSGFEGQYNAVFMETPDNSFDENFAALKSLQTRLHEIQNMDVKSFEYQTALQQITQQEQTEAGEMLKVFSGIYDKNNYFLIWNWVGGLNMALTFVGLFLVISWKIEE